MAPAPIQYVEEVLPGFDGRALDDLIDFQTYTAMPLLLLWRADTLPGNLAWLLVLPLLSSAYGFSQVNAKTWEEDILDQDVLKAGQSVDINFDDGSDYCMFDFRAIFDDGDELVRKNINVCEVGTYRYHE